jgi:hypothetical protein
MWRGFGGTRSQSKPDPRIGPCLDQRLVGFDATRVGHGCENSVKWVLGSGATRSKMNHSTK